MSKALAGLLDSIHLEKIEINIFRGKNHYALPGNVDAGLVLAQAFNAAQRTVSQAFNLHSCHAYFLRPSDPDFPIVYEVDRIRDGRHFVTRRVVAIQHGRAIFNVSLSYQLPEEGLEHALPMPEVAGPEQLISDQLFYRETLGEQFNPHYQWPIEFRQVNPVDPRQPQLNASKHYVWFKADGHLADDLAQHQEVLAYASNYHLLTTALRPHGLSFWQKDIRVASLDHALWMYRDFRIDEWLLYELETIAAHGSRASTRGNIFNRQGQLVASSTQEGLVRRLDNAAD